VVVKILKLSSKYRQILCSIVENFFLSTSVMFYFEELSDRSHQTLPTSVARFIPKSNSETHVRYR
jgi:hypothetical protein